MIYGYARVSTDGQSVAAQVAALRAAGAGQAFREDAAQFAAWSASDGALQVLRRSEAGFRQMQRYAEADQVTRKLASDVRRRVPNSPRSGSRRSRARRLSRHR